MRNPFLLFQCILTLLLVTLVSSFAFGQDTIMKPKVTQQDTVIKSVVKGDTVNQIVTKNDTTGEVGVKPDTAKANHKKFRLIPLEHSPKFAGWASAVLPGAGQIYNKKYWKLPIVYGGIGVAVYFIYQNLTIYNNFRRYYINEHSGSADSLNNFKSFSLLGISGRTTYYPGAYGDPDILTIIDQYRSYLDLSVIVTAVIYTLNIVDAVVDAHLYHFNISDDLSMNVTPTTVRNFNGLTLPGLSFNFHF